MDGGVTEALVRSRRFFTKGEVSTDLRSLHKKGVGEFTLPGICKFTKQEVAAKPKRKGINPFTKEEQWFAAKPASTKLKVRPLKKLKDAAV